MHRLPVVITCAALAMLSATTESIAIDRTVASAHSPSSGAPTTAPARMEWTDDGPILLTPKGMTLYTNGGDAIARGRSTCTNIPRKNYSDEQGGMGPAPLIGSAIHKSCAEKWRPYLAEEGAQPVGDFSIVDRPEGETGKQWSYRNFPLYLSSRDTKHGDRLGVGGGGFGAFGRGFRFAMVPQNFPAGLEFTRLEEGLVLSKADGKLVYTPRETAAGKSCVECGADRFEPILAPALAKVSGDWSIVDAGAGRRQFAFKGKRLYTAPESLKAHEIAGSGAWDLVLLRQGPGRPRAIVTHLTLLGDVYATKDGLTLYTFNCTSPARDNVRCDEPGDPAGYWVALCGEAKECARRWHPYLASTNAQSTGLWSVVDVAYPMFTTNPGVTYPPDTPRVKAWAYRGNPVYTYYEDKVPGDMWGDGIKWIGGSRFAALQVPGASVRE